MIQDECFKLIDHKLIEEAQRSLLGAKARFATTCADLDVATAKHTEAKALADAAIAGESSGDPQVLAAAAEDAAKRLQVAQRVVAGADDSVRDAMTGVETAKSVALRPVYRRGVEMRLAAARKADSARAMLAEAECQYKVASQILNLATSRGCESVVFDPSHSHRLTTYADEFRRFSENYHVNWWGGLDSDGNVKTGV